MMKLKIIKLIIISNALFLLNCSDQDSLYIDLPPNEKLEDTRAGWWIKEMGLSSNSNSKNLTYKIVDHLINNASLIDKYELKDNVTRYIWEYTGKNKLIRIREDIYFDQEYGDIIWFHYEYPLPGVPWKEVLPNHYMNIKKNRKLEHASTINSSNENARLFLFGSNVYCQRISLQ